MGNGPRDPRKVASEPVFNGSISKHKQASKRAMGCEGQGDREVDWRASNGCRGLSEPSVGVGGRWIRGGCGDVVWLCTDDIPYGGIMS